MDGNTKSAKQSVKAYFTNLLDMRSNMLSYDELHDMMEENTVIHGANMWILMLAILIASIGLNVNSTAVIIGAMLISPLMSGILAIGYSLAIRDLALLKQAAAGFATQVAISLITSTVYFMLSPLTTATSEMIARTSPTLWDVLIALFGGIAGSIGNTRQKTSNVIPGVAIATALMPPLCTVGYGIATKQLHFILGAFYLFMINTLFIALSALIVTKLLGVPCKREVDPRRQKHASRIVTVLIVVTVIPSILTGAFTVYKSVVNSNISKYLTSEFVFADTQVVQSSVDTIGREISVSLVGAQLPDAKISELTERLDDYDLGDFKLHIMQNRQITAEEDSDKVTIAVQENAIRELQEQLDAERAKNQELEASLVSQIDCSAIAEKAASIFTDLTEVRCGLMSGGDGDTILLTGKSSAPFTAGEMETIRNFVKTESGLSQAELQIDAPPEPQGEDVADDGGAE